MSLSKQSELWVRAEAELEAGRVLEVISGDYAEILHQLQTHQIELEMQNEELRRLQEELIESRDKFSDLYDFSPVGYLSVSEKGLILQMNLTMARKLGTERSLLMNQPLSAFVSAEDQDTYYLLRRQVLETHDGQSCELRMRNKSGNLFWVKMETILVKTSGTGDLEFRVSVTDISELKQTNEDLRESEKRFVDIMHTSGDAILIIDGETFIDCNEATVRMLGYAKKKEFLMTHPSKLSPPFQPDGMNSFDKANEMIGTAFEKGFHRFEWMHRKASGEEFPVEVSLTPIPYGGRTVLHCLWRDLTEQKRVEIERDRLILAIEQAAETIVITDDQGRIQYANPAFEVNTGYQIDEALGQTPRILKSGKHDNVFYANMWKTLTEGKRWRGELINKNKDGTLCIEEVSISPVCNAAGKTVHYVAVKHNITERKRAEEKLLQSKQEIEELNEYLQRQTLVANELADQAKSANKAKSEFLANISHEIRTPMTAVLGFSEILQNNIECCSTCVEYASCQIRHQNKDYIKTICDNGEYLIGIINNILDISKIEVGKLEVEHMQYSPRQILSEVVSLMSIRAEEKNLSLDIEYDGLIPQTIQTDPTRLRQILINLTSNAVKFTEIGKVRLVARLIDAESAESKMQFEVIDTGIGMTEEHIAKLFQPFSQADTSATRKFGGTGLGLFISQRLADMLGGEIKVTSIPGCQSTFTLTVPTGPLDSIELLENTERMAEQSRESFVSKVETSTIPDCRILLAEDVLVNQILIAKMLEKEGASYVKAVENGLLAYEEAMLALNAGNPYDVILMDMQMPVMDGYAATRQLRDADYEGPIIALTAHAMAVDKERYIEAGCNDYAMKPVNRQELIETITQHLDKRVEDYRT